MSDDTNNTNNTNEKSNEKVAKTLADFVGQIRGDLTKTKINDMKVKAKELLKKRDEYALAIANIDSELEEMYDTHRRELDAVKNV